MTKERNISKIREAIHFAIESHDGQFRKFNGLPYVTHPIRVAKIVRNHKSSKNIQCIIIAAILHDVVEDCTDGTKESKESMFNLIEVKFGTLVSSIVRELTSDPDEIKRLGKMNYLMSKMVNMSSYALVDKLADRLDNCSDLHESEQFANKYVPETRFILNGLNDGRYLSDTHKSLISKIEEKISVFE